MTVRTAIDHEPVGGGIVEHFAHDEVAVRRHAVPRLLLGLNRPGHHTAAVRAVTMAVGDARATDEIGLLVRRYASLKVWMARVEDGDLDARSGSYAGCRSSGASKLDLLCQQRRWRRVAQSGRTFPTWTTATSNGPIFGCQLGGGCQSAPTYATKRGWPEAWSCPVPT